MRDILLVSLIHCFLKLPLHLLCSVCVKIMKEKFLHSNFHGTGERIRICISFILLLARLHEGVAFSADFSKMVSYF